MGMLAFITFTYWAPDAPDQPRTHTPPFPLECRIVGDALTSDLEAEGYAVDYACAHTNAPAHSMRPRARPAGVGS